MGAGWHVGLLDQPRTWSRKLPITACESGLASHLPVITAALCVCSAWTWKVRVSSLLRLNMDMAAGAGVRRARAVPRTYTFRGGEREKREPENLR